MPLRGERLEKPSYAIIRSLHGGSVGEAWLATHEVLGHQVVQKTYSVLGLEDSVGAQEPRLLHAIDHPRVARISEAQWDPDYDRAITFVMPYYEGGSIADALDEGFRFSLHRAIKLAEQTLDGLAHVHTVHGYVHRDSKPGNIFLNGARDGAYVGDFGSAAEMDRHGRTSAILGSPLYTPPEGGPDDGWMGVPGDIFGVGMTLYEMLNGPFPYAEISPSEVERRLTRGHRGLPDRMYEEWDPCIPGDLRTVVRKALRRDPDERHTSCSAFIQTLQRIRCIDWLATHRDGLDGEWVGSWPPHAREGRRRRYQVTSRVMRGSRRRLVAIESRPGGSWRRFGLADATLELDDRAALERFFAEVAARAAQRVPAH